MPTDSGGRSSATESISSTVDSQTPLSGWQGAALALAFAIPLAVYGSIGTYARYAADDYCTGGIVRTLGFWAAQTHWYVEYSPRYAFSFIVSLIELAGPGIVPALPSLALIAWVGCTAWTLGQFAADLPWLRHWPARFAMAEAIVFATLATTPDIAQSLYWQTGMLTYSLPLILATLYLGWARRCARLPTNRVIALSVSLALPLIAGGLSETYLAPQTGALVLGVATSFWHGRVGWPRTIRPVLAIGLLGSLLALGLDGLSPSVAGREAMLAPGLAVAIKGDLLKLGAVLLQFAARRRFAVLLACVGLPLLIQLVGSYPQVAQSAPRGRAQTFNILATGAFALLLVFGSLLPAYYALGADPPNRALIVPTFVLVAWLTYVGVQLGALARGTISLRSRRGLAISLALLATVPLSFAALTFPERALAAELARTWDANDRLIRAALAAGQRDLTVSPQPDVLGEPYIGADRTNWLNQCVARWYGLNTIASSQGT